MLPRNRLPAPRARFALVVVLALAACADPEMPTAPTPSAVPARVSLDGFAPTPDPALAVAPASVTITQGRGILLGAVNVNPFTARQRNLPVAWSTSNPAVATVSSAGLVRAVAPGTATITARTADPQLAATSVVTVAAPLNCTGVNRRPTSAPPAVAIPAAYDGKLHVFRLALNDPQPCHRYGFRVAEAPIHGVLYQVAADGTPMPDSPVRAGMTVSNGEGWLAYLPGSGLGLADALRFSVLDDTGRILGGQIVGLDVIAVNGPPVAAVRSHGGVNVVTDTDVNVAAADPNGDPLWTCVATLPRDGDLYWTTVAPSNRVAAGECRQRSDLKYRSRTEGVFGCAPQQPPGAYPRTDTFRFYATDGRSISDTVTNTVAIAYVNAPPVLRGPTSVAATEDTPVGFMVDAVDQDGDGVRYVATALPRHGRIFLVQGGQEIPLESILDLQLTLGSQLRYVPDADFHTGTESDDFGIQLRDTRGEVRACDYRVRLDVAPVNDAPTILAPDLIASDDDFAFVSGSAVSVRDDARPTDVLDITLRAQGAAGGGVAFHDAGGFAVQRVSAKEVRFAGTVGSINTLLARGIMWTPADNGADEGELVIVVEDRGNFGAGGARVATKTVRVEVLRDEVVGDREAPRAGAGAATRRPLPVRP